MRRRMPELIEIEYYSRLAEGALGRVIDGVDAAESWFFKRGLTADIVTDALLGRQFVGARRIGKLLALAIDDGAVLGLRFGMTGRLVLDDRVGVEDLQYASKRHEAAWDRFVVHFDDGGSLRINDAR